MAKGYFEALHLAKRYKPDVVFSKGGFVAVPVVLVAKHYKIPVIIHESDMTLVWQTRSVSHLRKGVPQTFLRPLNIFPKTKAVLARFSYPRRALESDRSAGLAYAHLNEENLFFDHRRKPWICCCQHRCSTKDPAAAFKHIFR